MIKFKLLLATMSGLTTLTATSTIASCRLENNMVKIFALDKSTGIPYTNFENWGITELNKTKVVKYSLEQTLPEGLCKITFYFEDGSYDNTQNKWWQGYKYQYISYLSSLLNLEYKEEWN